MATALPARLEFKRSATWSRSACLRLARMTLAPCSTSAFAIASPIPLLAPVTNATRPSTEKSGTAVRIIRPMEVVSGKAAEEILERIFQPATKPSALDQAEETLRHPKKLVYATMSNRNFYWRGRPPKVNLPPPQI